jgi:hypothetical protein
MSGRQGGMPDSGELKGCEIARDHYAAGDGRFAGVGYDDRPGLLNKTDWGVLI